MIAYAISSILSCHLALCRFYSGPHGAQSDGSEAPVTKLLLSLRLQQLRVVPVNIKYFTVILSLWTKSVIMTVLPGVMLDDRVDPSEHSDPTILVNKVPFVNMNRRERVREPTDKTEY